MCTISTSSLLLFCYHLIFYITVPKSSCKNLDSTWSKVVTDPILPVEHGVEITLNCPADHVNKGGNMATCLSGKLVPTTTPPQCSSIGMCLYFFVTSALMKSLQVTSKTCDFVQVSYANSSVIKFIFRKNNASIFISAWSSREMGKLDKNSIRS